MPGKRLKASAHRSPGRRSGPRAATELFHALVEHSSEAVALLDETGAISYVSPAATRLLGYTVAELDRKSTRLNSSHTVISYAVFCLKKKKQRRGVSRRRGGGPRRRNAA